MSKELCKDCKHIFHDPGKCSKCNCGESERSHRTAHDIYYTEHHTDKGMTIPGFAGRVPPRSKEYRD